MNGPQPTEAATFKVGLTQEERELYSKLFKALDPENSGVVTGEKARTTFEKSGLPANILGEIWQLADHNNLGFLTQFGFCLAMRLIGYTQAGQYPTAQLAETPGPLPKFADLPLSTQLRSQSTSNSFLQTQPSTLIPQNTATQQSSPQAPIAPVSRADYEKFSQIFIKTTGSVSSVLDGNAAKQILMKAKLPTATLGQIWSLVDVNNRGYLDLPSFIMAMHLIHGVLSGVLVQLPPFLPEYVWSSVDSPDDASHANRQVSQSSVSSQSSTVRYPQAVQSRSASVTTNNNFAPQSPSPESEWHATSLQKQQSDSIFDSLDKSKLGVLAAEQVASFLMTSRLDQHDLATIWDLSDIQNTGNFTKLEFGIALFLINRRRAGKSLPDVVPQELIQSLRQGPSGPSVHTGASQPSSSSAGIVPKAQPAETPVKQSKSSMDDLVDIFGSSSPAPAANTNLRVGSPQHTDLQQRTSSSDLSKSHEAPNIRQNLTSSFKPTSSFGQSLMAQRTQTVDKHKDLIGEDIATNSPKPNEAESKLDASQINSPTSGVPSSSVPSVQPSINNARTVDYEALRSVPPPPQSRSTITNDQAMNSNARHFSTAENSAPSPDGSRETLSRENNDLLADSQVSGKLSQATSDVANFSNQIKSLTAQTSNLHEKKLRADQELTRVLALKSEINSKLQLLRTSYASEVKQVEQVELTLGQAKEELEALRSEASIAEAKFNSITNEFHEKQLAVEEHQKVNSALREKLGILNAEIAELESQLQNKTTENVRLSNEANVKKSQVQVAIVKLDELKNKILEAKTSHADLLAQIRNHEQEKINAEAEAVQLQSQHDEISRELSDAQSKHSNLETVAVAGIGSVLAGSAIAAVSKDEAEEELPQQHATGADAITLSTNDAAEGSESHKPLPHQLSSEAGAEQEAPSEIDNVSALVDEVKDHPAKDLTGLDDLKEVEQKDPQDLNSSASNLYQPQASGYINEGNDDLSNKFPPISSETQSANRASTYSTATGSYKQNEEGEGGETPVTSPVNSEYVFPSGAGGVVGGMVGMPGVLVGVQRTDSLTSSVQNNPSLSVRDDNIDEVNEEGRTIFPNQVSRDNEKGESRFEESSEGERVSSGVESFEMVNAEEAKDAENTSDQPRDVDTNATHPLAQSYGASEISGSNPVVEEEEFPSPQELDYDESSSDESDRNATGERFDDAHDNFAEVEQQNPLYDSDSEFNDLKPASEEVSKSEAKDEFFDEDFDNLRIAEDDVNQDDTEVNDISMDNHFTGAQDSFAHVSSAPDFSSAGNDGQQAENDEWEQLFAGFGNAPSASNISKSVGSQNNQHELAVQELVAMGFEKSTVIEALEKENYDVEAATNYLLDQA